MQAKVMVCVNLSFYRSFAKQFLKSQRRWICDHYCSLPFLSLLPSPTVFLPNATLSLFKFSKNLKVLALICLQHFSLDPGTTQECGYQIRVLAGHCGLGVFWSYWNCSWLLLFHKQYERRGKIKWTWISTYQKISELWICWHSLVGSYFRIQGI